MAAQAPPIAPFNYIRTVKAVLDHALEVVRAKLGLTVDDMRTALVGQLQNMTNEWFSGDTPNIAYCDPICRLAYLYCHVAANANLFELVVRSTPEIGQ